ncbi:exopolysaccharide Pel transporter PelG [Metabacillus mangrovi]|uniref:exopolysaccharide Pel transporter PelG n=1 Tax=Metabacillus mangrovi TaxID=1491830 RepID=UPI0012BA5666
MAGIGFQLQKLFKEDYYSSRMRAYLYSLFVTAGPWLIVIATLLGLQVLLQAVPGVNGENKQLFMISVSYCFMFSQVLFGFQQLVVTRYTADCLYEKKEEKIFPSFLGVSGVTAAAAFLLWLVFAIGSPLLWSYKLLMLVLFLLLNLIWIMLLYLSGAKNYQAIAIAFLAGGILAIASLFTVLSLFPYKEGGFTPAFMMMGCFIAGIAVTFLLLVYSMLITFPKRPAAAPFDYLCYFDKYPLLAWTGIFYNAGLWVSNWIIWADGGEWLLGTFRYHPAYDTALFYAYLTILPTYVIFVVSIETRFYERYRTFFSFINDGGTLSQIRKSKKTMLIVLKQELEKLVRSQGIVSLAILLFALLIAPLYVANDQVLGMFRLTVIGAFCNGMAMVMMLLLLYFDDRKGACVTSGLFFFGIASASLLLLPAGEADYGVGFTAGSLISFLYAVSRLFSYVSKADYYAFSKSHRSPDTGTFHRLSRRLNKIISH